MAAESARERAKQVLASAGYEWGAFKGCTLDALAAAIEAAEARGRCELRAAVVMMLRSRAVTFNDIGECACSTNFREAADLVALGVCDGE